MGNIFGCLESFASLVVVLFFVQKSEKLLDLP